jgi:hypothetical protein
MTRHTRRLPAAAAFGLSALVSLMMPDQSRAETIACRSLAATVKGVTIAEDYFPVTTLFQFSDPILQPLLETTISVTGPGLTCVVATFSAVVKPLDNYMVFQVTLDGQPMHGHTRMYVHPDTPVVIESEETDLNVPRMVAHQFFLRVSPGVHTVTVKVAGGSGFDPSAYPDVDPPVIATVEAPVLSLHYN